MKYHCNCCGRDFSEDEAFRNSMDATVTCPECGAERCDDGDDYIIEEYWS